MVFNFFSVIFGSVFVLGLFWLHKLSWAMLSPLYPEDVCVRLVLFLL